MESSNQRHREFSAGLLFQAEQWAALSLGLACLAAFAWAALDGHKAFSVRHVSHFSAAALVSIGWLLTIAVGLVGVALMRFAFSKPSEPGPDARSKRSARAAPGGPAGNFTSFISIAAGKGGR